MAVFGRRQPHGPLILRGLSISQIQPPVAKLITPRGQLNCQEAALKPWRPRGKVLIIKGGGLPAYNRIVQVGAVARETATRSRSSRWPNGTCIIKTLIRFAPAVVTAPVAKTLVVQALDAATRARQPAGAVYILHGLAIGTAAVGKTVLVQALDAALRARRPKGAVIIRTLIRFLPTVPPVGKTVIVQSLDAAQKPWRPKGAVIIKRPGSPPPVGQIVEIKQSREAALLPWRPKGAVIIRTLIQYQVAPPPVVNPSGSPTAGKAMGVGLATPTTPGAGGARPLSRSRAKRQRLELAKKQRDIETLIMWLLSEGEP